MSRKVIDTDKGFALFMKRAKKAARESGGVEIGVFDTTPRMVQSTADVPTTNVRLAAIHEFGLGNIPERSFLRSTADLNQRKYLELLKKAEKKALEGEDPKRLLGLIGEVGVADVKATITSQGHGHWPALAESTIKAKGSSQALIDTGQLLNSITARVVDAKKEASE